MFGAFCICSIEFYVQDCKIEGIKEQKVTRERASLHAAWCALHSSKQHKKVNYRNRDPTFYVVWIG